MSGNVPRTVTEVQEPCEPSGGAALASSRLSDLPHRQSSSHQRLQSYRDLPAYVLLGDPGAGKTTAFREECQALGDRACFVTARDFLTLNPQRHSEWRGKTLFIDGLDEIRAGAPDARTPFDGVRARLEQLGRPHFRLSCRHADWLGENDRRHLKEVVPDASGRLTVLALDPLAEDQIEILLGGRPYVHDTAAFIATARDRGVHGLLTNPQSLELLARVVASGGDWPTGRLETFKAACETMARERNPEHLIVQAPPTTVPLPQLLDAAGRLCAVQLLAGTAGYSYRHSVRAPGASEDSGDYPSVEDCRYEDRGALPSALATRLFEAVPGAERCFVPVHRHLAEFLGAGHLARVIDGGLPARRVIALMTGDDGIVVTGLRGLAAWLAARCPAARAELIDRDPMGIGQYGDLGQFSMEEKRALLASLGREAHRLDLHSPAAAARFSSLATPDMAPALREKLTDPDRGEVAQALVSFLLTILEHGPPLPDLSPDLLDIVRDRSRRPDVRACALTAFIHNTRSGEERTAQLRTLLAEVHAQSMPDPWHQLLGILLTELYPCDVPAKKVWSYLKEADFPNPLRGYRDFWQYELLRKSSQDDLGLLLDSLAERLPSLWGALGSNQINYLPARLLACGLKAVGSRTGGCRLFDWLGVGTHFFDYLGVGMHVQVVGYWSSSCPGGVDAESARQLADSARGELWHAYEYGTLLGEESYHDAIGRWLEQHPEAQKAIVLEGLDRGMRSGDLDHAQDEIDRRLAVACPPSDLGAWCLEQAAARKASQPPIAEALFDAAVRLRRWHREQNDGVFLDRLRRHAATDERFRLILTRELARRPELPETLTSAARQEARIHGRGSQAQQAEQEWLDHVRANEEALRENRAAPRLLHELAGIYLGDSSDAFDETGPGAIEDKTGPQAIEASLGGDQALADAALAGLRGVIDRRDLPTAEDILALESGGKMHYLGLPLIAGIEERERAARQNAPMCARERDEPLVRTALVAYCSTPLGYPSWFRRLLETRPELVAEVLTQHAVSRFRSGRSDVAMLAEMACDPAYTQVARHATLSMLDAFPIRSNAAQLECLKDLLLAARQHADSKGLQGQIEKKLSRSSMNALQRVHWLAAGLMQYPGVYDRQLVDFVQGREPRTRVLIDVLRPVRPHLETIVGARLRESNARTLSLLVRLVGPNVDSQVVGRNGVILPGIRNSFFVFVADLIKQLGAAPGKDASDFLNELVNDPKLSHWRGALSAARDHQRVIRRDAEFRHPTIAEIDQVLRGGTPANPADLAALLADRMVEMENRIRGDNTDDWRQFWNEDSRQRPTCPKHEDSCRDALLSDLRHHLPGGIDAQPEGHYANDRRADIRVSCRDFEVPIEIKKSSHRELWSAMRSQLMARYASAPAARGHGIYLVLWLGRTEQSGRTPPPPSGAPPADAAELRRRLEAELSPEERRKISVCVIDVSPPHSAVSVSRRERASVAGRSGNR